MFHIYYNFCTCITDLRVPTVIKQKNWNPQPSSAYRVIRLLLRTGCIWIFLGGRRMRMGV